MKTFSPVPLLVVLLALVARIASAAAPLTGPVGTPSLIEALNPDGTLRPGTSGSFDARHFTMVTAPDGRPVFRPAGTQGVGDERWQDRFGLPNGTNGEVRAVASVGAIVYVGGRFTVVGDVAANYVAKWDGTTWSSLGTGVANGVNADVYSLAVANNGDLYAGGSFDQAGGMPASGVAKWNGTAWSNLGSGLENRFSGIRPAVYALAVAGNGDLYAGGIIGRAGGTVANYVARWDGTGWSSLGAGAANGVNDTVYALAVSSTGEVYVGGNFTQAGGIGANSVARWNGVAWSLLGTFTRLPSGLTESVYALATGSNGQVYIGGSLGNAAGGVSGYMARWDGTAWRSMGAGNGVSYNVNALVVAPNGDVYAGGLFVEASGVPAIRVAKWNGTTWSPLGTGISTGSSGVV